MNQKFTSTIAGASIFISLFGLLSRGLGFIREMIFANNFGLGTEFDLYLIGAVLPVTINTIILYIGQNYFIPGFQKIKPDNAEESRIYYNHSFIIFVGVGFIVAISLYLLSDSIINFYMYSADLDKKAIAVIIFRIFLVTIPLSAAISIFSALLQTVYEFKFPAMSVLFLNLSIIILIFLFTDEFGIYIIPIGYVVGTFLQFIYLIAKTEKFFKLNVITHLGNLKSIKSVFSSSLIIILIIESVGQLYTIFDRYFYGYVSSGGIASLNYAYIIFYLPISIFSISLATAVFPKISSAINNHSNNELERIYDESLSFNIVIFMPLTFVLYYFGDTFIKLAFERGKFLQENTAITFEALKYYAISLVFYSAYSVLNKIFYSINLAKILLAITIIGIFLKLLVNFLLVKDLQQFGLALSTSITYIFFFISCYLVINYKLRIRDKSIFVKEFIFSLVAGGFSLIVVNLLSNLFFLQNLVDEILKIIIFLVIYSINLIFIKHKAVVILHRIIFKNNLINRALA
jgi:putative peptidoglycan lipid II flippase